MVSTLELQDLYNEALIREIYEKTQSGALQWTQMGTNMYTATQTDNTVSPANNWAYFINKSQIGNLSYKYTFNVKLNNVNIVTLVDGPLPYTGRDSEVQDLYNVVEMIVLNMNDTIRSALQYVQSLPGATG